MRAALHTETATSDDQPMDGPLRIAITAGIGCAFGGIIALTLSDISHAYDPRVPWYWLKLSKEGWNELISTVLVTIIVVLFLEPLIELIRWHDRRSAHGHPGSHGNRPRLLNWLFKIALGVILLLLSMSHDAIREYVDMNHLGRNGAVAVQLLAAVVIITGTTLAWAYSARFRLATIVGCLTSFSLGTATYLVYKHYEPTLLVTSARPDPGRRVFSEFTMTPGRSEIKSSSDRKPQADADKVIAGPDKAVSSSNDAAVAVKKIAPEARQMPNEAAVVAETDKPSPTKEVTPPGAQGKDYSLRYVFFAVAAWFPVGLFGGLILDYRRSEKPSTVLAFGLVTITVICDVALQVFLLSQPGQSFSGLKTFYWFGLGAGWAAGIYILGPSADVIFGRREKDVPALFFRALTGRWRQKTS